MIPIYRAKSSERKNTYVEGFLIGVDEERGLCTIRTKDDYIGGEICYLDTLSIYFEGMIDIKGNKIFASLQDDGKGGDILFDMEYEFTVIFDGLKFRLEGLCSTTGINGYDKFTNFDNIGIQQ